MSSAPYGPIFSQCYFFPGKVFVVLFSSKCVFVLVVGKFIVLLQFITISLQIQNFLPSFARVLIPNYTVVYLCYYFTIIATLGVTRELEGYTHMFVRRNVAAKFYCMSSIKQ